MIERGLGRAGEQALILADNLKDKPEALPKTFEKGELKFTSYRGWVSGFFPGELWLLYEATGNAGNRPLLGLTLQGVDGKESMERDRRWRRPSSIESLLKAVGEEDGLDRSYLPISLLVHVEPVFHIV